MKNTTCPTSHIASHSKLVASVLIGITAVVGVVVLPKFTQAQVITNEIRVVASPTRVGADNSLLLKPGEKRQITLKVRNVSNQPIDAITTVQDFIIDEDGSTPIPVELPDGVSNKWSLANWITIVPNAQTLQPNETVQLNALIEVPADALPGGKYAMVIHEPLAAGTARDVLNQVESTASESRVNPKVGTLVYVVVDGPINESAFIRDFSFPKFSEYGPVPFSFSVDNQSDIHITPQVSVAIFNIFGQQVETITLEPKNVFPLSTRTFTGEWDRVWGNGYYTAQVIMSFGQEGQVVLSKTSFWFFPATLVIGIGTAVLGLLAILFAVRRHLVHRKAMDKQRIDALEQQVAHLANPDATPGINTDVQTEPTDFPDRYTKRDEN